MKTEKNTGVQQEKPNLGTNETNVELQAQNELEYNKYVAKQEDAIITNKVKAKPLPLP